EFDESRNIVLCHTDTQDYTIYLYQPIKDRWDPEFDIYAVSGYEYTETDINGKEQLRSYYVGNDPWASLYIGKEKMEQYYKEREEALMNFLTSSLNYEYKLINRKHIVLEEYANLECIAYEVIELETNTSMGFHAITADSSKPNLYFEDTVLNTVLTGVLSGQTNDLIYTWNLIGEDEGAYEAHIQQD
ncbi:MAG: hypothetical protein J6A81_05180, partial [Peptococcaceae bacterium]|nr:hypothetical protein [Peptococcaceae bacterium]